MDCYRSQKSDQQLVDWHLDHSVSEITNPEKRAIRFIFYLTDTSSDNGCLGYIPKSNLNSYALKKAVKCNSKLIKSDYYKIHFKNKYIDFVIALNSWA